MSETIDTAVEQTRYTFDEDRVVIESQFANVVSFGKTDWIDIHVEAGAIRARRIIGRLVEEQKLSKPEGFETVV